MTTREWLETAVIWLAIRENRVPNIPDQWFRFEPTETAFRNLRKRVADGLTLDVSAVSGPHLAHLMAGAIDAYAYFPNLDAAVAALRRDEQTRWLQERLADALRALGTGEDVEAVWSDLAADLASAHVPGTAARSAHEVVLDLFERIEARKGSDSETLAGLTYAWPGWNVPTLGLEGGQLVVIAARPGVGKTLVAANLARYWARQGHGVIYLSLEMLAHKVMARWLAMESGVNGLTLARGKPEAQEWPRLAHALGRIGEWPLWLYDAAPTTLDGAVDVIRRYVREHRCEIAVIDYAGLLEVQPAYRGEARAYQVGRIATTLKNLAQHLAIPVVALVQLSREMERRGGVPSLTDLRDSGDWEASADVVWLLYHDETPNTIHCFLAKNRDGEANVTTALRWDRPRNYLWDPQQEGAS